MEHTRRAVGHTPALLSVRPLLLYSALSLIQPNTNQGSSTSLHLGQAKTGGGVALAPGGPFRGRDTKAVVGGGGAVILCSDALGKNETKRTRPSPRTSSEISGTFGKRRADDLARRAADWPLPLRHLKTYFLSIKQKMSSLKGKIQTVLGLIDPSQLGYTMTHEHLTMGFSCCYYPPPLGQEALSEKPIEMKNLFWLKQNPYSHKENLLLFEERDAVREELLHYKAAGGGSIVENTTTGIMRNVKILKQLSEETGVHVIAGAGFYVDATHSSETKAMSVEQLTEVIVNEVLNGADGSNIKCGVIGEIGCSWPLTDSENRVLKATAHAQAQLGCPVIIHPGRNGDSPFQIIRILQEAGADISKTVMSHLDRTIFDEKKLLEFAKLGCYLEYDLFGTEFISYHMNPDIDMPSDNERILRVRMLIEEGYDDKIVIAHDIHTKHRLKKYGGHGYSHILENIVPKMLMRGISQNKIDKLLLENPKQWLTFK